METQEVAQWAGIEYTPFVAMVKIPEVIITTASSERFRMVKPQLVRREPEGIVFEYSSTPLGRLSAAFASFQLGNHDGSGIVEFEVSGAVLFVDNREPHDHVDPRLVTSYNAGTSIRATICVAPLTATHNIELGEIK